VPAASAKAVRAVVVVGAGGKSVEIRSTRSFYDTLMAGTGAARASGGYVLVYPLLDIGAAAQPARFYPATRAYCASWTLALPKSKVCARLDRRTARPLMAVPLRHGAPPTAEIVDARTGGRTTLNVEVMLQLAFVRSGAIRAGPRTSDCALDYTATWHHATFPRSFCLGPRGVWADGMLRPLDPSVYEFARLNP
jgi:hypothetical protein